MSGERKTTAITATFRDTLHSVNLLPGKIRMTISGIFVVFFLKFLDCIFLFDPSLLLRESFLIEKYE